MFCTQGWGSRGDGVHSIFTALPVTRGTTSLLGCKVSWNLYTIFIPLTAPGEGHLLIEGGHITGIKDNSLVQWVIMYSLQPSSRLPAHIILDKI